MAFKSNEIEEVRTHKNQELTALMFEIRMMEYRLISKFALIMLIELFFFTVITKH